LFSILALLIGAVAALGQSLPLFDAHLHYSVEDEQRLGADGVLEILDRNNISQAVISGRPQGQLRRLYQHAPGRILPLLSVYGEGVDKSSWMHDTVLPDRIGRQLGESFYRGIGEIHIFARDRHSPVLKRIVELAAERELVLQVHGDAEVIDTIFEIAPRITLLWAHLGTRPEPGLLRDCLSRHPERLYLDTSVRDQRIAPEGHLLPQWRTLFVEHADRILIGVDTHWSKRWDRFDHVVAEIRNWLSQLPTDVQRKLAYENAERLFGLAVDAELKGPASE
jgi:hypothetical protein